MHDGGLYRSAVVSPGPFNPAQWTAIFGGTGQEHTPLHGFSDGNHHTLILHNTVDNSTVGNTIDFNNLSGETTAKLWTTGSPTDPLFIQSAGGKIALAPAHIGFDGTGNKLVIDLPMSLSRMASAPRLAGWWSAAATTPTRSVTSISQRRTSRALICGRWGARRPVLDTVGRRNQFSRATRPSMAPTALQVSSSNVHVMLGTASSAYNNGALVVDGGVGVGGNLCVNGTITAGNDITAAGNVTVHGGTFHNDLWVYRNYAPTTGGITFGGGSGALYYDGTDLHVSGGGVIAAGNLTVSGSFTGQGGTFVGTLTAAGDFTAAHGGMFQNDLWIYRSSAPTTGGITFGSGGFLYFNGTDLESLSQHIVAATPTAGNHVAIKSYVDTHVSTAVAPLGEILAKLEDIVVRLERLEAKEK